MKIDRALDFAKSQYKKNIDINDNSFIDELTGVADILEELDYGNEYQITAIFRNLLRDTSAEPFEILDYCSMEILEAVQILTKPMNCEMIKYVEDVKGSMLAFPVKLAEHLYNLRVAAGKPAEVIENLLEMHYKFYKKCVQDTNFQEPVFKAIMALKNNS